MTLDILVSGGGISGLAAAAFLARDGHRVTLIERAPTTPQSGYALSLKSFGLQLLAQLGGRAALERQALPSRPVAFYDARGALLTRYDHALQQAATHGAVITLRPQLHQVLAEGTAIRPQLGLHPTAISDGWGGLRVTLSNGEVHTPDLLVVCEGMRSTTRALVFPELAGHGLVPSGLGYAAARLLGRHGVDSTTVHTYLGRGRFLALIPVSADELVLQAAFRQPAATAPSRVDADELRHRFADFAPPLRRILAAVAQRGQLFGDSVATVVLPQLARGRVVFVGDAGYCPTFMSGMGASLGLLGAKLLATTLASAPDLATALPRYSTTMAPIARHFQRAARQNIATLLTEQRWKLALRNCLLQRLPPALLIKRWSRQFDIEQRLLHSLLSPTTPSELGREAARSEPLPTA